MTLRIEQPAFWFVWNPDGRSPVFRHPSCDSALSEAKRLARAFPGQTFIILESVKAVRRDDLLEIDMRPVIGDIPF